MPRKFFRKYLPSHAAISENRHIARFGSLLAHHNLWHLHRRSVAGGVAVGMFAGLIPGSNPVQFTAAALLAIGFHVNLPIAVIVTLYSNPFTIVPLYISPSSSGSWSRWTAARPCRTSRFISRAKALPNGCRRRSSG